ncbi:MAG: RNA polymerase sigma factor [Gemmatimonadales bacterium]
MSASPAPPSLATLLGSGNGTRAAAWTGFLEQFSALLLHVARGQGGDHDLVMDRYLYLLDGLQDRDFRRLRTYSADGGGKFTTWLLVVARRICVDHHRARYGRSQSDSDETAARLFERRQLVDLLGREVGLDVIEVPAADDPDIDCRLGELRAHLTRALGTLTPADRLILKLRFEDGHSVPQVARLVGEGSSFAMYRRIDRILGQVRQRLQLAGVEEAAP